MLTSNASSCSAEVERTVNSIFCCTLAGNTPKFITYIAEIFIGVQISQNSYFPGTPSTDGYTFLGQQFHAIFLNTYAMKAQPDQPKQ